MEIFLATLLALVVGLLLAQAPSRREVARTAYRLTELERRLTLVMDHLGVADTDPLPPVVREHLARGNKIKAIAEYRKITGADLLTAKTVVEAGDTRR
ncbi:hypothetical protein ACIBQ2_29465 [Micromonospora sediminimaris]|uniref:Ribosomal protein L7/L12 C-terminal domain-containing protein n=1 Tax=Micromonospora sediminimaris TaxID=547162 RepID=A0A9W5XM97_9ACTN|nr:MULTISPECIES: hypothetical protein [Micromonospora]WFE44256.1 hypothetical protein O7624_07870 [Verrucosispora sp. WMMD1129]GIJ35882.1 hypothetical protein Vse01_50300 [Micromonospora sediminimaris]SFC49492.1 hypothetical protein SAMN05216284_1058 [Micromonospora sediminimaris]